MITNSNPFLRNDYYPDQNDIDELNTRINEVQSDVDLLAISVNEKTEAVNGRLNTLQNDYNESFETDALKANTADLNVLNVNVQATIKDLNVIDTYTENLIVNKPVQDISLRTPHLENATSLNGNFYAPNILGGKIDNIQFENIQNFKAVNIEADVFKANVAGLNVLNAIHIEADGIKVNTADLNKVTANTIDLNVLNANEVTANVTNLNVLNAVNIEADGIKANKLIGDFFSAEPIASSAVVGYDENGQLIPIRASYDALFPESADYLKTDAQGIARKGTSESEIVQSTNLIQAGAVQNMYDAVNANFNNVSNSFNAVNANFDNVSNSFNAVNANFDNVQNTFNDFANNLNSVNLATESLFNGVNNTFNDVENSVSALNNTTNNISNNLDSLLSTLEPILGVTNISGWNNSTSPLNIQGITEFKIAPIIGPVMTGSDVGNGAKLNLSGTVVTLALPTFQWTTENMSRAFYNCRNLNQNIQIPNGVTSMSSTFYACVQLNQNIQIPNGVTSMSNTFGSCSSLNQNILIPNSVTSMSNTFLYCSSLNQNIQIPNRIPSIEHTFSYCTNLNQNILIPNSVTSIEHTFEGCTQLNQSILIPNSVILMSNTFDTCRSLNQSDIYIYSQNLVSLRQAFNECHINNVHIPTSVPKSTSNRIYNSLVNGTTGITFPDANIFNDLPVDIEQWPPV